MGTKSDAPATPEAFNKVYRSFLAPWVWGDVRIPKELKRLVADVRPASSLELGCGLGRFSRIMAKEGIQATAVDFSSVAIAKAKARVVKDFSTPTYLVGDVTNLEMLNGPFDVSFDVGCFHCLDEEGYIRYVSELHRLLRPGGSHLLWALDRAPSDLRLDSGYIARVFQGHFQLVKAEFSRRRVIGSHWYWLVRVEE